MEHCRPNLHNIVWTVVVLVVGVIDKRGGVGILRHPCLHVCLVFFWSRRDMFDMVLVPISTISFVYLNKP